MRFFVFGIGNSTPLFTQEQKDIIAKNKVFSGGKRHFKLVKNYLPHAYKWLEISSPLEAVFDVYKAHPGVVVFCSGNPLFYGFANTLKRQFPKADIKVWGYKSSVQILCERLLMDASQLHCTSLHGRHSWKPLASALMQGKSKIAILTDAVYTPNAIAQKMLDYGYDNYQMYVGENLESPQEKVYHLDLKTASHQKFASLNVVLLQQIKPKKRPLGIADVDFKGLPNRPNMITKMPIRLTTLHALDIKNTQTFWDIGFCTGSVSIEALLQNPNLNIVAFEKRAECQAILAYNAKKMGAMGIHVIMGDFLDQDLSALPLPQAVFIGGHSAKLKEIMQRLTALMPQGGRIVCNAVQQSTAKNFHAYAQQLGLTLKLNTEIKASHHQPIQVLLGTKDCM